MADLREQLQELSELRRRGSLNAKQFKTAKAYLLSQTQGTAPSPLLELQIELAALDRHWNFQCETFKMGTRDGWRVPHKGGGARKGKNALVIGSVFAGFATFVAVGATSQGRNPVIWMPVIVGTTTTLIGFFSSVSIDKIAEDYERAEAKYQAERDELEAQIRDLS